MAILYDVLQPTRLHESGSAHGKLTVVVAGDAGHPHGIVSAWTVLHPGTKQFRQTVPVTVAVGQATGGLGGRTVVVGVGDGLDGGETGTLTSTVDVTSTVAVDVTATTDVEVVGTVRVEVVDMVTVDVVIAVMSTTDVDVTCTVAVCVVDTATVDVTNTSTSEVTDTWTVAVAVTRTVEISDRRVVEVHTAGAGVVLVGGLPGGPVGGPVGLVGGVEGPLIVDGVKVTGPAGTVTVGEEVVSCNGGS